MEVSLFTPPPLLISAYEHVLKQKIISRGRSDNALKNERCSDKFLLNFRAKKG